MKSTKQKPKPAADYAAFIHRKTQLGGDFGFDPLFMPDFLFPFQRSLVEWQVRRGRSANFSDCGLGKTPMQLVWAQNMVEKTCKPSLILTPLAVGPQTVRDAHKFGIEAAILRDGAIAAPITVTNYHNLHKFDRDKFGSVGCDESSILKNFDGEYKAQITEFMRKMPYRALYSATAAPNDYIELGTSSEALGDLGFVDMLGRFFKKAEQTTSRADEFRAGNYRFRGHAEKEFWRWVCSWARACRKPSDLGFPDDGYVLPELKCVEHVVRARTRNPDWLIDMPAIGLREQRAERRRTMHERCELAASLVVNTGKPAVMWCDLNPEGELLAKLLPDAVEVAGRHPDEFKEEALEAFALGQIRVLITKGQIAGFGLNWQHCAHQTCFPSHSLERWYQSIRRSWRFGQKNPVTCDLITSEGESGVLANWRRKSNQMDHMFAQMISLMNNELRIQQVNQTTKAQEIPAWL